MRQGLYALGSNGHGQLGNGHMDDTAEVHTVVGPQGLITERPTALEFGGTHSILLLESDPEAYYVTGSNDMGQFGDTQTRRCQEFIRMATPGHTWKRAAAGWTFSLLVDEQDQVYSCGHSNFGGLGRGQGTPTSRKLGRIEGLPDKRIAAMSCCLEHVVVLYDDGEVWGWGGARKGQLGLLNGPVRCLWVPRKLALPTDAPASPTDVHCGREFTLVSCRNTGHFTVLGTDKHRLQTLSCDRDAYDQLHAKHLSAGYSSVGTTWTSIHFLLPSARVLSLGSNRNCQHAPREFNCESTPQKGDRKILQMVPGSEHIVVEVEAGSTKQTLAWGWAEHGNCGIVDHTTENMSIEEPNEILESSPGTRLTLYAGTASTWLHSC